jgi:hypothetical protein
LIQLVPPHHGTAHGCHVRRRVAQRVAAQVAFDESKVLKPVSHLIGSRVETGRLSSYGSTGFANLYSPTRASSPNEEPPVPPPNEDPGSLPPPSRSGISCICEKQRLEKPVYHFSGSRVETRRLSAMGQGESTCIAPPSPAMSDTLTSFLAGRPSFFFGASSAPPPATPRGIGFG